MDRRMVMAMVLAVVVLVLNALIFGRQKPSAPPIAGAPNVAAERMQTPSVTPGTVGKEQKTRDLADGSVQVAPIGEQARPEALIVDTAVLRAEIDPLGGAIRAWRLKRYTDSDGNPADLVRTRDLGAHWFAIRLGPQLLRTDSTLYASEVSRNADETVVRLVAHDASGVEITKTFTIPDDRYDCRMDVKVSGVSTEDADAHWEIGWVDGLPSVERDAKADHQANAAVALHGKEFVRVGASHGVFGCSGGGSPKRSEVLDGAFRWFGVRNKYFLGVLMPAEARDRRVITGVDGEDFSTSAIATEPLSVVGPTESTYRMYLGPIQYGALESYKVGLERVQDLGPGIFRPFSRLLMKSFLAIHKLIPNYGYVILILSILTRVIFYPLTKKSMDSMKRMQQLKPEMDRLNERYKDDPERRNRETLELYRKHKVNPLGGCLPILIQIPILSGLYFVLANAVELRKEPFALWIRDLSAPDTVAHLAGMPVNILPLLMAGTMVWQQKLTPMDPRQASLGYIMPIFMTFLFYTTPSGLVFYWTVNNLLTVLQQVWANRSREAVIVSPVEAAPKKSRKK